MCTLFEKGGGRVFEEERCKVLKALIPLAADASACQAPLNVPIRSELMISRRVCVLGIAPGGRLPTAESTMTRGSNGRNRSSVVRTI